MPIMNKEYADRSTIYRDDQVSSEQMNVDNSTMSAEDESVFRSFANSATAYAREVSKKKFYDFNTKNKSFLALYQDLYHLGIKNNKFFLRLYDRDLVGIDPYSPVLPKETQIKIFIECLINPWYWIREVLRIPTDGMPIEVGGGVQYQIDRNNAAGWYLFLNGVDHYRSKPRQTGKTQDCVGEFNYAYHFGNMASTALFFNKDQDQANVNLYRLKCQRDMMPAWMQMRMVMTEDGKFDKGIDNTKSIRNPVNGNIIQTMGKATSKESAMKLGRGATAALQYYDEFDFIPYQTEIMNAASFAYSTAARNAAANGALFGRILSSTPGDLDMRDGAAAAEYIDKMLVWNDSFFDEPIEKLKKIVNSPSYNRFIFVEHSWQQLKKPMKWYEEQCALVSYNLEVIMREIDLKRIHGSSQSPFKRNDLLYLMNHKLEPIAQVDYSKNLCNINIYEKLKLTTPYILSIDPSEGLAQDNNSFTLINPYTQKPVAEFKSPYISQPDLCVLCCRFLDEYCPKSMIVVESNKGRELINRFLETKYKYQLYYDDGKLGDKVIEKTDKYGALKRDAMQRRAYGIWTGSNRSQYYAILENIMEERKDLLLTPYLVEDVCGLIRKPNGRVEAGPGNHDDNIMSYLIGMFVYLFAPYEKLEEYGIRRGASDTSSTDYDEKGNITEEGTLRQLIEMYPSLPESMKLVIDAALKQDNPIKSSERYYKEVNAIKEMNSQRETVDFDMNQEDVITPSQLESDQAFWGNYDEQIWNSNDYGLQPGQKDFDLNDYID